MDNNRLIGGAVGNIADIEVGREPEKNRCALSTAKATMIGRSLSSSSKLIRSILRRLSDKSSDTGVWTARLRVGPRTDLLKLGKLSRGWL